MMNRLRVCTSLFGLSQLISTYQKLFVWVVRKVFKTSICKITIWYKRASTLFHPKYTKLFMENGKRYKISKFGKTKPTKIPLFKCFHLQTRSTYIDIYAGECWDGYSRGVSSPLCDGKLFYSICTWIADLVHQVDHPCTDSVLRSRESLPLGWTRTGFRQFPAQSGALLWAQICVFSKVTPLTLHERLHEPSTPQPIFFVFSLPPAVSSPKAQFWSG